MPALSSRRTFLTGVGGVTLASLAGCTTTASPLGGTGADRTLYIGAYHWGFILLDENGTEQDQVDLDVGSTVDIVSFGAGADEAISKLPSEIKDSLPSHEELEARNKEHIPAPSEEYLHEALEDAEKRYPDHSLAIVPTGYGHGSGGMMDGGMMDDGMMGGGMMGNRGMLLPHDAPEPTVETLAADKRGEFTLGCGAYCGYGHEYMGKEGAIVVQ